MSNARNLALLLPNASGQLPDANLAAIAASKLSGQLQVSNHRSGTVIGSAVAYDNTAYTSTTGAPYIPVSVSYTPKLSSAESDILMLGVISHGLGPKGVSLDPFGLSCYFLWNGSQMGYGVYSDVFAGSGDGVNYGPEYDVRTCTLQQKSYATWSAGTPITIALCADGDGTGGIFINRCAASTGIKGVCSLTVLEIKK